MKRNVVKFAMKFALGMLLVMFAVMPHIKSMAYDVITERDSGLYGEAIPDVVWEFVEENWRDVIEVAVEAKVIDTDIKTDSQVYITKPYIIVGIEDIQSAVYKFPFVLNSKVFMILTVTDTMEGFKMNFGTNISEELNQIDYLNKDYVFYESAGRMVAESESACGIFYKTGFESRRK